MHGIDLQVNSCRTKEGFLEETLLKKGFFQTIFPKLLKVFGKGFKGKTLFQKGFPLMHGVEYNRINRIVYSLNTSLR